MLLKALHGNPKQHIVSSCRVPTQPFPQLAWKSLTDSYAFICTVSRRLACRSSSRAVLRARLCRHSAVAAHGERCKAWQTASDTLTVRHLMVGRHGQDDVVDGQGAAADRRRRALLGRQRRLQHRGACKSDLSFGARSFDDGERSTASERSQAMRSAGHGSLALCGSGQFRVPNPDHCVIHIDCAMPRERRAMPARGLEGAH